MRPLLEINLKALQANYNLCQHLSRARKGRTGAVIKANAYGLGAVPIAKALYATGCRDFFVSYIEEALALTEKLPSDVLFYILHGIDETQINAYHTPQIIPILNHKKDFELWQKKGNKGPAWLQFDTGMGRLGFKNNTQIITWLKEQKPNFPMIGFMSHYACADELNHPLNHSQTEKLLKLKSIFPTLQNSMDASAMSLRAHTYQTDLTRPGILLYGGNPLNKEFPPPPIRPVLSIKAKILQIEKQKKGTSVGYGASYRLKEEKLIGTLSIGYADGLFRALSNKAVFSHKGYKLPVIGRISMDLTTIDLSALPQKQLEEDSYIEILGEDYTINDMAKDANTIPYEIITNLGNRFKRIYQ